MARTPKPQVVLPDLLPRLAELARARRDAVDALSLLTRQRDRIILEAVDQGIAQTAIAAAAGLTPARITAIIGDEVPDPLIV